MASFPSMPLWTDAYLSDTGHLSFEEHGVYMMLLMTIWRSPNCRIPNEMNWIQRRLRASQTEMEMVVEPIIKEFFDTTGNWIFQKRLKQEYDFVSARSKTQSDRAKLRWQKEKEVCQRNATPGNAPTPTPTPSSIVVDTDVSTTPPNEDLGKREPSPDDLFESWYKMYPRKVGVGGARKAFKSALKKADYETLCRGRDAFIEEAAGKDKSFIPYAATWLNQERWTDDQKDINPIQIADGRSVAYISSGGGRPPENIATAVGAAVARRRGQF
jgi:uncharacterized protein YdaU (DUF1376 family)